MDNPFFEHPVLNAPYQYPMRHWELDDQGQPTHQIIESRRRAEFITPIPKPRKRKGSAGQQSLIFDEGKGLSSQAQQYDPTPVINALRRHVDEWRSLPNPASWRVTPETVRLLEHWRHHPFNNIRPFFCQVEAVEAVIWLSEVAPNVGKVGKVFEQVDLAVDFVMYKLNRSVGTRTESIQAPVRYEILPEVIREAIVNLPKPDFAQHGGEFTITLWRDWLTDQIMAALALNDRQRHALVYLMSHGKISNVEYQKVANAIKKTATRDLNDLKEKGLIEQVGHRGPGVHYVLLKKRDKMGTMGT